MSIKAINWALELPLPPTPKLVLVVIADYADDLGYAFPGIATISRRASVSERTLTRVLADLEESGYLTRERRHLSNGNRTSDGYHLTPEGTSRQNGALTTRQNVGDKPPTVAPVEEPSVEPPVKRKRATALPADWMPSNAHRLLAADLKVDVEFEAVKFRDWTVANAVTKVDWEATFRNWLRNSKPTPTGQHAVRPGAKTPTQRMQDVLAIQDPRAQGAIDGVR